MAYFLEFKIYSHILFNRCHGIYATSKVAAVCRQRACLPTSLPAMLSHQTTGKYLDTTRKRVLTFYMRAHDLTTTKTKRNKNENICNTLLLLLFLHIFFFRFSLLFTIRISLLSIVVRCNGIVSIHIHICMHTFEYIFIYVG